MEVTGGEGVQDIEAGVEPEEGDRVPWGATEFEKAEGPEEAKDGKREEPAIRLVNNPNSKPK